MVRKLTKRDYEEKFYELHTGFKIIGEYSGRFQDISVMCLNCGNVIKNQAKTFLLNRNPIVCAVCNENNKQNKLFNRVVSKIESKDSNFCIDSSKIECNETVNIKHVPCGYIFNLSVSTILDNRKRLRCESCELKSAALERDLKFRVEFQEKYSMFSIINKFVNSESEIVIVHNPCGHEFSRSYDFFQKKRLLKCPRCNNINNTLKSHNTFLKELYDKFGDEYTVLSKYINCDERIKLRHNVCDYVWNPVVNSFMSKKSRGCPKCSKGGIIITQKEFEERLGAVDDIDEYMFLEKYISYDTKIKIKHLKCNHEYFVSPNKFFGGRRCPRCKSPKGEIKISRILDRNNIQCSTQKTFDGLVFKRLLKFDFCVTINDRAFLIEYDGIQHFKPVKWYKEMSIKTSIRLFKQSIRKDNRKNEFCKNNNITLYRIPYTEINRIYEIVTDIIEKERSTTIPRGSTLKATVSGNGESVLYTKI